MVDRLEKVIKGFTCCDGAAVHLGHCPEDCPYFGESERADKCVEKLHSDALSLLKAQEPRVMTSEEWENAPEPLDGECMCYEIKDKGLEAVLVKAFKGCKEYYGKDFRCWTSRPTDEQREVTPWE